MAGAALMAAVGMSGQANAGLLYTFDIGGGIVEAEDIFAAILAEDPDGATLIAEGIPVPTSVDQITLSPNTPTNNSSVDTTLPDGSTVIIEDSLLEGQFDLGGGSNIIYFKAGQTGIVYADQEDGLQSFNILQDAGVGMEISNFGVGTIVPLPGAVWLMITALGGLFGLRWWRGPTGEPAAA
jgi:hypothetical protein